MSFIDDVDLEVTAEFGRTSDSIANILEFAPGTTINLETRPDKLIDIYIQGKLVARGEIVVLDDNYGVRITQILKEKTK